MINSSIELHDEMSKQKPRVILEHRDESTFRKEEILEADEVYAVFYDDKPINIKSSPIDFSDPAPKYKKSSFQNPGFAINLAKKLNERYQTDKFTVVVLNEGRKLYP